MLPDREGFLYIAGAIVLIALFVYTLFLVFTDPHLFMYFP